MTSVKAKLIVTLKADEVVVAEIEDAFLWQRVLTAINGGKKDISLDKPAADQLAHLLDADPRRPPPDTNEPLDKLAREITLDRAVIEGACSPTTEAPFMHLNSHNWEAMRKKLPVRGKTALSPMAAAATVLALWFRAAQLGNPTQAQALAILGAIGVEDKNPSRGVRRATWLIPRPGGQIQLNASEISTAVKLTKAFCSKNWDEWAKGKSE